MADSALIQTIAAGIAGGVSALTLVPLLLKGDRIVLARELKTEKEHCQIVCGLKDAEISKIQDSLSESQKELREANGVNAELTEKVFTTVDFLKSLAGLASSDRRNTGRQSG